MEVPDRAWIRERRPPKAHVDPWTPLGHHWEEERTRDGGRSPALVAFLAGAECPFTCLFCDLWKHTLDGPTPEGAIPAQLRHVLSEAGPVPDGAAVKLYNASNWFDARAVPAGDDPELVRILRPFERVVVECHPRLVGSRCFRFASALEGILEVAMGLETVHPAAFAKLNLGMELDDFDEAAGKLTEAGIAVRAFVLLSPPFVPFGESVGWTVRAVEHAARAGAAHVTILPTRSGNGAVDELRRRGEHEPPTLDQLEAALTRSLVAVDGPVVTADLWDAERVEGCGRCRSARIRRIEAMNASGRPVEAPTCPSCGA